MFSILTLTVLKHILYVQSLTLESCFYFHLLKEEKFLCAHMKSLNLTYEILWLLKHLWKPVVVQHATLTKASCEQTSGVLITVCKDRSCCQVPTLCLGEDMIQGSFKKKKHNGSENGVKSFLVRLVK